MRKRMSAKKKTAVILAGLAGCMWGTTGLYIHVLGAYKIGVFSITLGRFAVASILLLVCLMINNRKLLKIHFRDLPLFIISGVFGLLFFNISYGIAIEKSSMSAAAVLLYTSPAIATFLSALIFREKITKYKAIAAALSVLGCAFVSGIMNGFFTYPTSAYLWGMSSAFGYALYGITASVLLKRYHPITVLFYASAYAAIGGCMVGALNELAAGITRNPKILFYLIGIAFVCNILAYLCYNFALKYLESSYAMVVASIEPVVASLLGMIVFGESMDAFGILGIGCILSAVVIGNRSK